MNPTTTAASARRIQRLWEGGHGTDHSRTLRGIDAVREDFTHFQEWDWRFVGFLAIHSAGTWIAKRLDES